MYFSFCPWFLEDSRGLENRLEMDAFGSSGYHGRVNRRPSEMWKVETAARMESIRARYMH